jgi:hypothetical protein
MSMLIKFTRVAVCAALAVGVASSARVHAQAPGQPGGQQGNPAAGGKGGYQGPITPTPWFTNPQIGQQLKFNETQQSQLGKAYQQSWDSYQKGINGLDKTLTDAQRQQRMRELQQNFHKDFSQTHESILTDPEQRQRYNQLHWQYRGYSAFEDPQIAEKLRLTPEQRDKFGQYNQQWSKQMNEFGPSYYSNPQTAAQQWSKMQGQQNQNINSVLTPQQQQAWQQMTGQPYNFQPNAYFSPPTTTPNPTNPSGKK